MRKVFFMIALCLGVVAMGSCNANGGSNGCEPQSGAKCSPARKCCGAKGGSKATKQAKADVVEVLYFHGKQRCASCVAIEQKSKELVETAFAEQVKEGRVVFKSVDITENEALADKYEVSWSSLIVVARENGKESYENITDFGFSKARTAPDVFKKGLEEQIKKMLK